MHFDRLVELGELDLLDEGDGFLERVAPRLDLRGRSRKLLSCFLTHLNLYWYKRLQALSGDPPPPKLTVAGVHRKAVHLTSGLKIRV